MTYRWNPSRWWPMKIFRASAGRARGAAPDRRRGAGKRRLLRNDSGVSAIEFAIGALMLVPALLWMSDLGLGFVARMELERHVRSGADAVMLGETRPEMVGKLVDAVAGDLPGIKPAEVNRLCEGESPTGVCADGDTEHLQIVLQRERTSLFSMRSEPYELEAQTRVRIQRQY